MLPPNLQKNIRELDRQISLLETECQNMDSDTKLSGGTSKITSEIFTRESPNKSLTSAPVYSSSLHSSKKTLSVVPKMYSTSCIRGKPSNEKKPGAVCEENSEKDLGRPSPSNVSHGTKHVDKKLSKQCSESDEKMAKVTKNNNEGSSNAENLNTTTKFYVIPESSGKSRRESKSKSPQSKRSITSIKEVTESSDENERTYRHVSRQKKFVSRISPKGATWSDLFCQQVMFQECRNKKTSKKPKHTYIRESFKSAETISSEDGIKDTSCNETEDKTPSDNENKSSKNIHDRVLKRRRTRSVHTRKHYVDEISDDVKMSKALHEKQIQCKLWNDGRENSDFWCNLNNCIKTLHFLTGDLKSRASRNRRQDIINEMQNTIMRITDLKTSSCSSNLRKIIEKGKIHIFEGGENNILELKKALAGVKQFCEELASEKAILADELASKNRLITNMKDQEKEYLTLISNLKFNLEKIKDESMEGTRLKKELALTKNKLIEEAKVIEGLKKSHEKMQVLIENYVMENDRLRTQIKLSKLESHKYHVLLAGKEIEIKKYKEDIEQFQKQITEQLNLLKSKAKENRYEDAINIINNQTNMFTPTEAGSTISESTVGKQSYMENFYAVSGKTSMNSAFTQENDKNKETTSHAICETNKPEQQQENKENAINSKQKPCLEVDKSFKDGGFASCKSDDSDDQAAENKGAQDDSGYGINVHGLLNNSKKLRSSIEELIQGVRRECLEKFLPSSQNSVETSLCTLGSTSSEIIYENNEKA